MADDKAASSPASSLMALPLEVRHAIFEHVAVRPAKPKKLLRYWFEKQETKAAIAQQVASNPDGPTPRVAQVNYESESDSEVPDEEAEENSDQEDDDGDDEEEEEEEENEANEESEDEDEANEEAANQDMEEQEQDAEMSDQEEAEEVIMDEHPSHSITNTQQQPSAQPSPQSTATATVHQSQTQADGSETIAPNPQEDEEDEEAEIETEVETGAQNGENNVDEDDDETMDEDADTENATAPTTQPPRPATPLVYAHRKWRHIPKFMRITHCPPPVELLLTSKQLNDEVKNWYYDVAVLRIEATGSFAHTSFFEEAFSQITEASFSPMENIRKAEVTFVWDTTWIRADTTGCVEAIFPALLRQRSMFVYQILTQAPDLKEVVIHWHDSAQDGESASLRMDILEPFDSLCANVKVVEHYIATDAKPDKRSIAGQRRVEFQNILDSGLDRLF